MTGRYVCVHCGRERGNGCGCVSRCAPDRWAEMRENVKSETTFQDVLEMVTEPFLQFGKSISQLSDQIVSMLGCMLSDDVVDSDYRFDDEGE